MYVTNLGSSLASDFPTTAEKWAFSFSMDLQWPPHQVFVLCFPSNPQVLRQASPKAWEHPKPVSTKEPMQLPNQQATHLLLSYLPAQPCRPHVLVLGHLSSYGKNSAKHLSVSTHLIPKPHGNLLEGGKFFGPYSHMVSLPYFWLCCKAYIT